MNTTVTSNVPDEYNTFTQNQKLALAFSKPLEERSYGERSGPLVIYNSDLVSDLVIAATRGLIVKEEVIEESPRIEGKHVSHYCKLRALIKPINMEKRGNFKILRAGVYRADREKGSRLPVFQENDEIQVSARVNKDSYINIFSVSQDGMISRLFPNSYFKNKLVGANKTFTFPEQTQKNVLKLKVTTPGKLTRAVESVLIIATREEVDFLSKEDLKDATITDLMKELSELDPSLWAEKTVGYEVRK